MGNAVQRWRDETDRHGGSPQRPIQIDSNVHDDPQPKEVPVNPSGTLSRLLPEQIPPRIKASRDRIARSRSQLVAQKHSPAAPLRGSTSPPRPDRYEDRTSSAPRAIEQRSRYPSSNAPGSPNNVIVLDDMPSRTMIAPTQNHAGRHGVHDQRDELRTRGRGAEAERDLGPLSPTHHSRIEESSSEDSEMTPTKQARRLKSYVDNVYLKSKELTANQRHMEDEMTKIKELYETKSESLHSRALQLANSGSVLNTYEDGEPNFLANL